jgi:hypothetical protein
MRKQIKIIIIKLIQYSKHKPDPKPITKPPIIPYTIPYKLPMGQK